MTEPFSILIADNDPESSAHSGTLLQESGYAVEVVRNGRDALNLANANPVDLILLDVMMPDIAGYDVCKRLKSHPNTRGIPVIFLTAKNDAKSIARGFRIGAVDFIAKPFQREELLARVKMHLEFVNQQRALDKYADLLEEKNLELKQKNAQLEELNASKDTFFSIIAHDVKSPLAGFLSFAELLRNLSSIKHEQFQELVTHFRQSAEHLLALLENLLTWAQIQRGTIEFSPQRLNLRMRIESALNLLRQNAEQKQIALSNTLQQDIMLEADVNMLETVLRNLLSNAIKFTPRGGRVEIHAACDGASIKVMVSDTGIGVSEENAANVFRIGKKVKKLGTAGEKGTGLGLVLCKEFVEKHGGKIGIESQVNLGTTVWFTLPLGNQGC